MVVTYSVNPSHEFWQHKRVLITGHTGFKGAWLALWLARLGARVTGVALEPVGNPNLFELAKIESLSDSYFQDIRDADGLATIVRRTNPDIVFHLAAQPLVRASYREPISTFSTNVMGTAHLLEAVRAVAATRVVVAITTDKVYRNQEHFFPYRETDELGGHDPYSASKAAAELVIASYRSAFLAERGVAVASVRAGNVIGGGDWAEDRLIPDLVRAWHSGKILHVRRPEARRPWQHVLEPLAGYLILAERLWDAPNLAGAYNFGPLPHEADRVRTVIEQAQQLHPDGRVSWAAETTGPHEAAWLSLEIAKARDVLGFMPRWSIQVAIRRTLTWYQHLAQGINAEVLCYQDIDEFQATKLL